jgi:class 3 adenylate cyclase/tetratricopeptide (TPR) repeat protein
MICPSCKAENPEGFRLCGYCGATLAVTRTPETRKVVTLVFADVTGSTALGERLDAESARWVMSSFFELARTTLERHGGLVEKFIGDAVMAAFGIPLVREDDALRAVRAAGELRDQLSAFSREVEARYGTGVGVRIGVNTGEVVAGDASAGEAFASGDAVNLAARLEQAAAPGDVLLGDATLRLVRDAVAVEDVEPLTVKGKSQPVAAWRLLDVLPGVAGVARIQAIPLIGRADEIAELSRVWRRVVDEREVRVATIIAPAGTGKSRLLAELAKVVEAEGLALIGRCLPYGEGITFWPIAEAVRLVAGIAERDSQAEASAKLARLLEGEEGAAEILDRLAPTLGLAGAPAALEETFWSIRKLLEALARRSPLMLVLDDVHWAEETLLDLIEYLTGWTRGVPLLLVCSARPELLERRPQALGPRANATVMLLGPLGSESADELVLWQLGAAPMPEALKESVLAAAEGNPLFVQELVRMLIDDGLIVRRQGAWEATAEVAGLAMPPTIQALLAARLDQLEAGERDVAQRASVVGHVFWSGAVRDLCAQPTRAGLGGRLHTLVRKELIVPETSSLAAEDAFRFGHILVRDAAYAGLPKRTRAELHEQFADWLTATRTSRVTEHEEILGYHLEQAARYLRELGDTSEADRVAKQASARLASAGRRAHTAGDSSAAANLLLRAAAVVPAACPEGNAIRLDAVPALFEAGRLEQAVAAIDQISASARDETTLLAANAWRAFLDVARATAKNLSIGAPAAAWLAACEEASDHAGQATALGFLALTNFYLGRVADAEEIWERAADEAALAGDTREETEDLIWLLASGIFGPAPLAVALERCDAIERRPDITRKVHVMCALERGLLRAMQGDVSSGRAEVAAARRELEELGLRYMATASAQEAAILERLAQDPGGAETILREALKSFEEMGEKALYSSDAGMLAHALYEQGRIEEARAAAELCENATASDDLMSQYLWRSALAKVNAREGNHDEALALATQALELVSATDYLIDHADRLVDLAEVHRLAGRHESSLDSLDRADELYLRKGCLVMLKATDERRSSV